MAILFRNMYTRSLKLREYSIHQHLTYYSPRPDFGIITLQLLAGYREGTPYPAQRKAQAAL